MLPAGTARLSRAGGVRDRRRIPAEHNYLLLQPDWLVQRVGLITLRMIYYAACSFQCSDLLRHLRLINDNQTACKATGKSGKSCEHGEKLTKRQCDSL